MSAGNKVLRDIVTDLEAVLNKCGVMYHVFYRTKSEMSIKNKLGKKSEEYRKANKKMQDLLALRIRYKLTMKQQIPHFKPMGKMCYFNRLELEQWLQSNRVATETEINQKAQSFCMKGGLK